MNSNHTVQELASNRNLWETYVDPDNNAPFGDMSQFEREQMIREIWPEKNPHAAALGALGGSATTDAKAAAARENGKRGGRPRKTA